MRLVLVTKMRSSFDFVLFSLLFRRPLLFRRVLNDFFRLLKDRLRLSWDLLLKSLNLGLLLGNLFFQRIDFVELALSQFFDVLDLIRQLLNLFPKIVVFFFLFVRLFFVSLLLGKELFFKSLELFL